MDVHTPWALGFARQLRPSDVILTFNWDVIPEALMVKVDMPFCRYDWTSSRLIWNGTRNVSSASRSV
jgi:hypothetical protein